MLRERAQRDREHERAERRDKNRQLYGNLEDRNHEDSNARLKDSHLYQFKIDFNLNSNIWEKRNLNLNFE